MFERVERGTFRLRPAAKRPTGRKAAFYRSARGRVARRRRGSTRDDVDAERADDAEELAVAAWQVARPGYSFRPLLTLAAG